MNVNYHRGKQYSYFEIEVNEDVCMTLGSLCPHFPSNIWKQIVNEDNVSIVLNFHTWTLKVHGEDVFFTTPTSELKIKKECCKLAFLKASGDSLYFTNDVPDLC